MKKRKGMLRKSRNGVIKFLLPLIPTLSLLGFVYFWAWVLLAAEKVTP
jgi:hypothetical protein